MYNRYTLDNGLRIVTEHIPFVKSISLGIWIEAGSKKENTENNGISHFIEHMLFKGTETRTAKDIADLVDGVGGQINAFTSKECTCYYIKVLDSHYELALDLLADMLFNSKFDPLEIEKERGVILEEISMYEDSPEDLVHDILAQTLFKNNSVGLPIAGTGQTLANISREMMLEYIKENYTANNAVLSIVGNFDEEKLFQAIKEKFSNWHPGKNINKTENETVYNFETTYKSKEIEQDHLCIGFKGVELDSDQLYPLLIVNNILGGSMSSRLFQSIREERGLVYSIYSYPSTYKKAGSLIIYAGMNPNQTEEVCKLIYKEINKIIEGSVTEEEVKRTKEQLKGNYILGLESTSSRMTTIGKSELLLNKIYTPKETIDKIDAVTMEDIDHVVKDIFNFNRMALAMVGKRNGMENIKNIFKAK